MAYATLSQLKTYLGLSGSADDALLEQLLGRATAAIERYTHRRFTGETGERRFSWASVNGPLLWLGEDLLQASSIVDGDGGSVTEYRLLPPSPPHHTIYRRSGWNPADGDVKVVGVWGYSSAPPPDVVHACIRLAGYYYRQRDAQVFDVTALPEQGVITVPKGMPADVKQLLDIYRRVV